MTKRSIFIKTIIALTCIIYLGSCKEDEIENNPPTINDQDFIVPETADIGMSLGFIMASDEDGDNLLFDIISRNDNEAFGVNRSSGEIAITDIGILDFNRSNPYTLVVKVDDGYNTETAYIDLMVSKNDPLILLEDSFYFNDGVFIDYGEYELHYLTSFYLTDGEWTLSENFNHDTEEQQILLSLNLHSPGNHFKDGTYLFANDVSSIDLEGQNFFRDGYIYLDGNGNKQIFETFDDLEHDKLFIVTDGKISVTSRQAIYTLRAELKVVHFNRKIQQFEESYDISFTFTSRMKFFDRSN